MPTLFLVGRLRALLALAVVVAGLFSAGAVGASTTAWKVQPSPNPGGSAHGNYLTGVAATSSTNAWAVGFYVKGTAEQTLVEHWNGKAWKVKPSPNPGGSANNNFLYGVAATSSTNAWAVGYYFNGTAYQTLVEHWNGKAWKVKPSPNVGGPSGFNYLYGVTATSSTNAWAVGYYINGPNVHTLVEHWNGKSWKVEPSPNPSCPCGAHLSGVAATSSTNAWAIGSYSNGPTDQTLVEHWNGKAWKIKPSPNPGGSSNNNNLYGVAATSSTNAWAVGRYSNGSKYQTLVEHWNGKVWKVQLSPNPGSHGTSLNGVAAISPTTAWAVGNYSKGSVGQTLIERWNGKA